MKRITATVLCLMLSLPLAGCGENAPANEDHPRPVSDAVVPDNAGSYYEGECSAEGHKIPGGYTL